MGGKARQGRAASDLRAILESVERDRRDFLAARTRYEESLHQVKEYVRSEHELLADELAGLQAPTRARASAKPAGPSGSRNRRAREDYEQVADLLVSKMEEGSVYTGDELRQLSQSLSTPATFVARVRRPLHAKKRIQKVIADGSPWRRGMSPASARWRRS